MSSTFSQHCNPFGVSVFAAGWPRDKFLHACNVLAQMLDNDQDGCADDVVVVKKMRLNQAGMAMFPTENSANFDAIPGNFRDVGLFADETELSCSGSTETADCRDAAIEEIMHLVTGFGISAAYPNQFGECFTSLSNLSTMQQQMDTARGGHFQNVPGSYPSNAIYHYDDTTCDYVCQSTEFFYWALTSLLDGQGKLDLM